MDPIRGISTHLNQFSHEMKIYVLVRPNSRKESVEKIDEKNFIVRANAPAKEGKANKRVIELLSEHMRISKGNIALIGGATSREKIFDIP